MVTISHWLWLFNNCKRRRMRIYGTLFLVLLLLTNEKLRSSGWISFQTGFLCVRCFSNNCCGLRRPRGEGYRMKETSLLTALTIVEPSHPRDDLVMPSSKPRRRFTHEQVEMAKEAAMRSDNEWYLRFIQGREDNHNGGGSVVARTEDGPTITDSMPYQEEDDHGGDALVIGNSHCRNKLLRLRYSHKEISELDEDTVQLLLERNISRPTSGLPRDWLRENVVGVAVQNSRDIHDFDGNQDSENDMYDLLQPIDFDDVYEVHGEQQRKPFRSQIIDLLPTLEQFKGMLRKEDEIQIQISGPNIVEDLKAANKVRIKEYQNILNSLGTEERGYRSYPEETKKKYKQERRNQFQDISTNPNISFNNSNKNNSTVSHQQQNHRIKSLLGYVSDGFKYMSDALRDVEEES